MFPGDVGTLIKEPPPSFSGNSNSSDNFSADLCPDSAVSQGSCFCRVLLPNCRLETLSHQRVVLGLFREIKILYIIRWFSEEENYLSPLSLLLFSLSNIL